MSIAINIEQFSGPLDLLLDLIHQKKIDIYNIPIHRITKEFLDHIQREEIDAEKLSDFVLFGAMLLEIKSRMLLPDNKLDSVGMTDTDDPRHALMVRLLEYQKIRRLESFLQIREKKFIHHQYSDDLLIELPPPEIKDLSMDALLLKKSFEKLLHNLERYEIKDPEFFKKVNLELFSVKEAETKIGTLLEEKDHFIFQELFKDDSKHGEKVASFLAILKMGQRSYLTTEQEAQFKSINVKRKHE